MKYWVVPGTCVILLALGGVFVWLVGKLAIFTLLGLFLVAGGVFFFVFGIETRGRLLRRIRKAESDRRPKRRRKLFKARAMFILFDVCLIAWVLAVISAVVGIVMAAVDNWSLPRS